MELHGRDLDEVHSDVGPHRGGHHEGRAGAGKIIEAKGGAVLGEFYRTGRRWRRVDDNGDCTRKPGVRQRKGTLAAKPYHPDPAAAYKAPMDPATARTGLKKAGV